MKDFGLIIGGEAGFGIMTTAAVFSRIASRMGYHVFDYVEYPSLIRGGHNAYMVHVSEKEVYDMKKTIDYLVCLNKETYVKHKDKLTAHAYVIYDQDEFSVEDGSLVKIAVPFKKILQEQKGPAVMKNTIALGAVLATLGTDLTLLFEMIEKQFSKKGEKVVEFNKQCAQIGYDHVKNSQSQSTESVLTKQTSDTKLILSGNEAFSLGSAIADCRLYVAYPMTPASTVLTVLAAWQTTTGMVVRHAEDEISVINTALGASFAGVRASVGTSGGGFALMVESISLSGITEIPIVIFLAQRPGPATGIPTWTEQGDLLFAVHAGHGEFPKIVLAPGDAYEMLDLTVKAYDLADIYQLPVIVMSDMLLSESHKSIPLSYVQNLIKNYTVQRGKTVTQPSQTPYLRYRVSEDGISERLIPGFKGTFYQANSYEHLENGHTTEDAEPRIAQVKKRERKWSTYLAKEFQPPKVFGDLEKAKTVFVSWGTNKGAILHAQELLKQSNTETAYIHFTHLYPLSKDKILPLFEKKSRYILVENNSHGQFGKLLRMETGINIEEKIVRFDGRPLTAEQIAESVMKSET